MRAHSVFIAVAAMATITPVAWTSSARADEKVACARAAETAQQYRSDGKLREAHEQLLLCARSLCPPAVSKDCDKWLTEVEGSLSSVVVSVRDADGRDLVDVRVRMDGAPLLERLDGKAVFVDPGPHSFEYEVPGRPAVQQAVVVREGEKNRALTLDLPGRKQSSPAPAAPARGATGVSPLAYVFGGVGVLSLAGFGYFVANAQQGYNRCKDSHSCTQSDVDTIATQRTVAWVLLGSGVVASGVAVWLFTRPLVEVHPVAGGLVARVGATF